ncbi:MAG: cupredoxin domain-containing protein [Terriglobia bacterium]|nr:cupredoxin domain-containing protein [Terriglobia bacterium]
MKVAEAILLFLIGIVSTGAVARTSQPATERIEIVAKRYAYEPAEITVHKGQPVTLELTSADVTHGLAVKELGIKTEIKKGKTAEVTFTPETAGTFIGKCSHFCGMGHGRMKFKIHVIE